MAEDPFNLHVSLWRYVNYSWLCRKEIGLCSRLWSLLFYSVPCGASTCNPVVPGACGHVDDYIELVLFLPRPENLAKTALENHYVIFGL